MAEMAAQASIGNMRYCLGTHEHEGGELEYEWIDWSIAFDLLRSRIRELVEEARKDERAKAATMLIQLAMEDSE